MGQSVIELTHSSLKFFVARCHGGVLMDRVVIQIRAPADSVGESEFPIDNVRDMGNDIVFPGYIINVDLHDPKIRDCSAEVGAHQGRQMAIKVVRRYIALKAFSQCCDLHRLPYAIPRHVHDRDIHRLVFKKRAIAPKSEQ